MKSECCFAVRRSEALERLDTDFHRPAFAELRRRIAGSANPVALESVLRDALVTGFAAGKLDQATEEAESIPQIRPTNIIGGGYISFDEAKLIPKDAVTESDIIQQGEVLFNNTNSSAWVGKSAVYSTPKTAVCSNHVTRLRIRAGVPPALVSETLNLLQRAGYFRWLATNFNNQAGVNNETLRTVQLPLGSPERWPALVKAVQAARSARDTALANANDLLDGLDQYVMRELGLTLPAARDAALPFATKRKVLVGGRLDPQSHAPFGMPSNPRGVPLRRIGDLLADPAERQAMDLSDDDVVPYLGLPECDLHEVREVAERRYAEVRGRSIGRNGDILFARIEPSVFNKKYVFAEKIGVSGWAFLSTEFYAVRVSGTEADQRYFYALLLTELTQRQVRGKTTGTSGRRRLDRDMFDSILVPWPGEADRKRIAIEVERRRQEARALKEKANADWALAMTAFEAALFEPTARHD